MKIIKVFSVLILFLVSILAVNALDITLDEVKLDGDVLSASSTNNVYDFERGQELDVKVKFTANENANDVQVEVAIRGYDHDDLIEDITDAFDVKDGVTYTKKLTLPLRDRMDQDSYLLRVRIENRAGSIEEKTYKLDISTKRHSMRVKDVILSPSEEVRAGRALLASVRLENTGQKKEDGIKVTVSIPELGVSASDYIDELEESGEDDQTTTEELYLRIPDTALTGEYTLRTVVEFDDGDEREVDERVLKVIGEASELGETPSQEKTIITLAADAQSVQAGGNEVAYPIALTNAGSSSKTYVVSANGASWATFRVNPSNVVVLDAGESKAVSVYVAANANAPAGQQTFSVTISSDNKVLKQIPLTANVAGGDASTTGRLKKGLEVGLVVLVVLLVIIGLIISFNKLRGDEDRDEEGETYY